MIKRSYANCELVPACSECNLLLGSKLFTTVPTRAAYLLGAVSQRYIKLLRSPVWDDEDFDDVGEAMKLYILSQRVALKEIHRRLGHLEIVATS